jgi:hypothetical protein
VAGLRWPAAWAFVVLTKVTPGIGLVWFAARGEWRSLAIAGIATLGVVGASWLIEPALWSAWLDLLLREAHNAPPAGSIAIPIWLRLPIALGLVVFAARTDRRWLLVVSCAFALPVLWWGSLSLAIGAFAFERVRAETWLFRTLHQLWQRRPEVQGVSRRWAAEPEG